MFGALEPHVSNVKRRCSLIAVSTGGLRRYSTNLRLGWHPAALPRLDNNHHRREQEQHRGNDGLPGNKPRYRLSTFSIQHKSGPEPWMAQLSATAKKLKLGQAQSLSFVFVLFQKIEVELLHEGGSRFVRNAPQGGQG